MVRISNPAGGVNRDAALSTMPTHGPCPPAWDMNSCVFTVTPIYRIRRNDP